MATSAYVDDGCDPPGRDLQHHPRPATQAFGITADQETFFKMGFSVFCIRKQFSIQLRED
jgi:hypothetical protein